MAGMRILEVAYHRNGCAGEPFYAVRFTEGRNVMLALVFEREGGVMVLDPVKAATSVAAGENSWRGDLYEAELRKAIERFETARTIRAAAGSSEALH
ncbi:MAG TPA: hypothetical protein VLG14_18845 [Sphingomonas sp.]|nr:hypothetical protein [Sphingomonas sp.]